MGRENFFKKTELNDINIDGEIFKYKPLTAGDELDWMPDYMEKVEVVDDKGVKTLITKQNNVKLAVCKFRNIMELPFTKEELVEITKLDLDYSEYTNTQKDNLFRMLDSNIYGKLALAIDEVNKNQKKD